MNRRKLHPPSPALVLAGLALFISLGGSALAAASLAGSHARAHAARKKKQKPLTKGQVNALIAAYFKSHKNQLRGAPGLQGIPGKTGPAGPGAIPINGSFNSASSGGTHTLATIGPWTVQFTCSASAFNADLNFTGPGQMSATETLATGSAPGATYVVGPSDIGGNQDFHNNSNQQTSVSVFLVSGSTEYHVNAVFDSSTGGLFENCDIAGDAYQVKAP